jgi:hypothetical protein
MGSGEFGSNGSVHWKIVHTADEAHQGFVRGRDPSIPGNMKGLHVVPKFFTLRLRFPTERAARLALEEALKSVDRDGHALVRVPAISRDQPDENLPWEIKVEWNPDVTTRVQGG